MLFHDLAMPRAALGLLVLASIGCLQPGDLPDATPPPTQDVSSDTPVPPPVDASTAPCSNGGEGRLRVAVSLAPSLASRTADVWLAVQCGDDPTPVRLVRWDGSPTQTLDGFGPGTWRVFGSTHLLPGAWSTSATLGGVSTAAVSLTLDDEGSPLAQVTSSTATGGDAGVSDVIARDAAGGGPVDASVDAPSWSSRVAMREGIAGPALGWASITAYPLDATSIVVRVTVQSLCSQPPCAPLSLHSVEARIAQGNTPVGFARGVFQTSTLPYGESTVTMPHLVLRGVLPDARHALQLAVFSSASAPRASAAARRP